MTRGRRARRQGTLHEGRVRMDEPAAEEDHEVLLDRLAGVGRN
jgi:hypothetical protein